MAWQYMIKELWHRKHRTLTATLGLAVTLKKDEINRIQSLPGIQQLAQGLLIWVFDLDRFSIILGFEPIRRRRIA